MNIIEILSDKSRGCSTLVLPVGREHGLGFVVSCKSVNTGLYENQSEFGVLVFPGRKKKKEEDIVTTLFEMGFYKGKFRKLHQIYERKIFSIPLQTQSNVKEVLLS